MSPAYLASLGYRRRRRAHRLRYAATYRLLIPAAAMLARRGPVELAIRLAARWSHRARIVSSLHDGRGWTDDIGDELDDLAVTTTIVLRDRLDRRMRVDKRDRSRLATIRPLPEGLRHERLR